MNIHGLLANESAGGGLLQVRKEKSPHIYRAGFFCCYKVYDTIVLKIELFFSFAHFPIRQKHDMHPLQDFLHPYLPGSVPAKDRPVAVLIMRLYYRKF